MLIGISDLEGKATLMVWKSSNSNATLKKNISYQLIYRVLTVITPLITSPWISRALGPQVVGVYSATQTYINYFLLFALLGVETYGTRTIASARNNHDELQCKFWNIYSLQVIATLLASAAYFGSIPFLPAERKNLYLLQGIWLLSYGLDINWFFFGCEEFSITVKRNMIVKLLTVFLIVVCVRSPKDLAVYIVIMAGGALLSQAVLWVYIHRYISFQRPHVAEMRQHICPLFILFVPILAGSIYHLMDKSMIDLLSTEQELGWYYSADKVINIPLGIITGIGSVMMSRITNMLSVGEQNSVGEIQKKGFELTSFFAIAISLGIVAVAVEFVPLFFGPGYEPCVALLYLFAPVLIVKAWSNAIRMQLLIPYKKDKAYVLAVLTGAAINLLFNFVLIQKFASKGAVIATLISEFAVLFIEFLYVKDELPIAIVLKDFFVYLLIGVIMVLMVRHVAKVISLGGTLKVLLLVACGGIIFVLLSCVYWFFDRDSFFHHNIKFR